MKGSLPPTALFQVVNTGLMWKKSLRPQRPVIGAKIDLEKKEVIFIFCPSKSTGSQKTSQLKAGVHQTDTVHKTDKRPLFATKKLLLNPL